MEDFLAVFVNFFLVNFLKWDLWIFFYDEKEENFRFLKQHSSSEHMHDRKELQLAEEICKVSLFLREREWEMLKNRVLWFLS